MSRIILHFTTFVLLSLLLHLGVFSYFLSPDKKPAPPVQPLAPFFVDLQGAEEKPRELDLPLPPPLTPRTRPGRRLAAENQQVDREQAPPGNDRQDQRAIPPNSGLPVPPVPPEKEKSTAAAPVSEEGILPSLSREALLQTTRNAAQSIADLDPEANRKMRREVEEGKAVWLDTEHDLLGSFYKRFRSAVEDVWDYPKDAIARGESGVCLYRIEINRAGVLTSAPELLKSSGSARLDAEAARAVAKASPRFGFLPDAYPYETLTIFAYFDYRLGNRPSIYGESYYR